MATENDKINVDYKHPTYRLYGPEWDNIQACLEGERAIRAAGTRILPHPATTPLPRLAKPGQPLPLNEGARFSRLLERHASRYVDYQRRAPFLNATSRTQQALLGLAFAKPVQVELTGRLSELEKDADGSGQPLTQFIRDLMAQDIAKGRAGIMPWIDGGVTLDQDGQIVQPTQQQSAAQRIRLRWFNEKEIINWREKEGKTVLVVVKYKEELDDPEGFDQYVRDVWIELRIRDGKAWIRTWYNNTNSDQVSMAAGVPTGLKNTDFQPILSNGVQMDELPWAWVGAENNDSEIDSPPLEPIASMNIKHYIAEADVAEAAHIASQPTLVVSGLSDAWARDHLQSGVTLGATEGIKLPANSKAELLQAKESNLSVTLCERREKQLAMLGAALIERGTAPKTATEAQFDAQTDNSVLSMIAGNVEQAINKALQILGEWVGGATGTVTLNKRYTEAVVDSQAMVAMMAGVQGGTVRLSDFIRWMMSNGLAGVEGETVDMIEDDLRNQAPLGTLTYQTTEPEVMDGQTEVTDDEQEKAPIASKKKSAPRTRKTTTTEE